MITIFTDRPEQIKRFLTSLNLSEAHYSFNGITPETKVIVRVGSRKPEFIRYVHTYVLENMDGFPTIFTFNPADSFSDPEKGFFIRIALEKAIAIDRGQELLGYRLQPVITIIKSVDELTAFAASLTTHPVVVDIECHRETHELTCIGFSIGTTAWVLPFEREGANYWSEIEEPQVWKLIAEILENKTRNWILQNGMFDMQVLGRLGIQMAGKIHDTMTLAHLLSPELGKGLADLARIYLFCEPWKGTNSGISNEGHWNYNGRDCIFTGMLYSKMISLLDNQRKALFLNQLVPLHQILFRSSFHGLPIDHDRLANITELTKSTLAEIEASLQQEVKGLLPEFELVPFKGSLKSAPELWTDMHTMLAPKLREGVKSAKKLPVPVFKKVATPFVPTSPNQVKEVIIALGHKIPKKKNGNVWAETTDETALKKLMSQHKHQFYRLMLEHREQAKILSTYCAIAFDSDNRLRFSINPVGTITSRFSSSQTPWGTGCNVQNIPKAFRKIVLPENGDHVILNMDFKQADPHVVGWLAGQWSMLEIMDSGGDLHAHTASAIAGKDITKEPGYNKETSVERKLGKAANNALNYGMGAKRFSENIFKDLGLIVSPVDAQKMIDAYFTMYPAIKAWHQLTLATVYKTRTLTTPHGRVRYFYGPINHHLDHEALAYVPPCTVSDALNESLIRFLSLSKGLDVIFLVQCHDSLTFSVNKRDLDKCRELLLQSVNASTFVIDGKRYKFDADFSSGPNWGEQR
jgi:DNA polymerase-1